MKLRTYVFLVTSLFYSQLLSQALQQEPAEVKYRNEEGRFEVYFPSEPSLYSQKGESEVGELEFHLFIVEPQGDDNINYSVSYIDYPRGFTDTLSREELFEVLDKSLEDLIKNQQVSAIGTFNHYLIGYPGREYRLHYTKDNYFSRFRLYIVKDRLYILQVQTAPTNNFNKAINQFFNSFQLINTPANDIEAPLNGKELNRSFFTIEFPGPTEVREIQSPSEYGLTKSVFEYHEPKTEADGNLGYFSGLIQYPSDITEAEDFDLETFYDTTTSNALQATQSSLIYSKEIEHNGIKGVENKQKFKGGQIIITTRIFLVRDHLISLQLMTLPQNDGNDAMVKFFDSLNITSN